jgi:hypothetical protein
MGGPWFSKNAASSLQSAKHLLSVFPTAFAVFRQGGGYGGLLGFIANQRSKK